MVGAASASGATFALDRACPSCNRALSDQEPTTRCSRCAAPDCGADFHAAFRGESLCQEHLADRITDEEIEARIDAGGFSSDLTIRIADWDDASAVREALDYAHATGREVDVSVIVRVAERPTKRACNGMGPDHSGYPVEMRVAGRDTLLCDSCRAAMKRYDAQVAS